MVRRQAVDDCRLDEVAVGEAALRDPPAAREDLAAVGPCTFDGAFVGPDRVLVDHRAQIHVAVQRVADFDALRLLDQQLHEAIADLFRHVYARAARCERVRARRLRSVSHIFRVLPRS